MDKMAAQVRGYTNKICFPSIRKVEMVLKTFGPKIEDLFTLESSARLIF